MTFLGDVETISCSDGGVTSDFFPLPPPILPHHDSDAMSDARQKSDNVSTRDMSTKSSSNATSTSSSDSPDYVESSV